MKTKLLLSQWVAILFISLFCVKSNAQSCEAVATFSENFDESTDIPDCWNTLKTNSNASFATIEVTGQGPSLEDAYSSPNHVRMFNQLDGEAEFYLITPEVNTLTSADHQLRFFLFGNSAVNVEVGTMTDPVDESTFTMVGTLPTTPEEYQEYTVPFDESYTNQHVAIKVTFTDNFKNIYMDNVTWEPIPSCPKPSDLMVENIMPSAVDVSWTANGDETEWEIKYGEPGFDPETEGVSIMDDDGVLGETLSDLEIGTNYEFHVKAICGTEDESEWTTAKAFTTACDVYALDYAEDFASFLPNCWEEADAGNIYGGPSEFGSSSWTNDSFLNNEENGQAAKIILFGNSISDWLISPEIDLSTTSELSYTAGLTELSFTEAPETIGTDDEIKVLITNDGGTTWETLKIYNQEDYPSDTGDQEVIDLSAYSGIVQIAFLASDGQIADESESYEFFIDDFAVNAVEVCQTPTDVIVTPNDDNTIDVSWTENGDATSWEIKYGEPGFDPETEGTSVQDTDELGEVLTDLEPGASYDVYVRAICAEEFFSDWSEVENFTTLGTSSVYFESFEFYPNPVKNSLKMSSASQIQQVTIYNMLGRKVIETKPNSLNTNVKTSALSSGVYLMKVQIDSAFKTFKIIKK